MNGIGARQLAIIWKLDNCIPLKYCKTLFIREDFIFT